MAESLRFANGSATQVNPTHNHTIACDSADDHIKEALNCPCALLRTPLKTWYNLVQATSNQDNLVQENIAMLKEYDVWLSHNRLNWLALHTCLYLSLVCKPISALRSDSFKVDILFIHTATRAIRLPNTV